MKMTIIGLFLTQLFLSCTSSPSRSIGSVDESHPLYKEYIEFEKSFQNFHVEIDKTLELRKMAISFYLSEKKEGDAQYFTSSDLEMIKTSVRDYIDNRNKLLNIANKYRDLIQSSRLKLTTKKPTHMKVTDTWFWGAFGGNTTLYINPTDPEGVLYLKKIQISLAAALTLYDNYIIAIKPYHENDSFRRTVNFDNVETQSIITKISGNFRKLDNYNVTLKAVEFIDKFRKWNGKLKNNILDKTQDLAYFDLLISGSYTHKRIKEINLIDRVAYKSNRFRKMLRDVFINSSSDSMNSVSKIFGNSVGLIQFREGYMKTFSNSNKNKIKKSLKAGDVLLEKTPFRLTDKFIPGHWGHVAIWTGTKNELIELGVWDLLPSLYKEAKTLHNYKGASFQSEVERGNHIIEALRPGVQINSLDHFLNIDDFASLRDESVSKKSMKEYMLKAFAQIGKSYDFNFDVETDRKIVCSELAFVVYSDYEWPIDKTIGRYTISPDHVALKSMGDGPFKPVLLYHDGKEYLKNIQKNFNHLMNLEYEEAKIDLVKVSDNVSAR
jgi:uncharacterized protein YycO